MRDLSIRGAGNLLGSEQSGFIDSVGFDLYSQLLEEAIHTKLGTSKQKDLKCGNFFGIGCLYSCLLYF